MTVVIITILLMASILLVQTPMVQTYVGNRVLQYLSKNIEGEISFERIHIKPLSNIVLKNVVVVDTSPSKDPADPERETIDTLVRARYIIIDFDLGTIISDEGSIHIDEVTLKDARMNLVLEQSRISTNQSTNLTRMFKLEGKPKPEKNDKEIFKIKRVKVEDMTFTMSNYAKKKTPYHGGINWNDLQVYNIHANADGLHFKGGVMSGTLNKLSFREKSGFTCLSMKGKAKVGNGLTHITDMSLEDPHSIIRIPEGNLIYSNVKDFSDYIHKVRMDIYLGNSLVDFQTISYFAPQLKGNALRVKTEKGRYHGTVDDFTVSDMAVEMEGGGFSAVVNGRLAGIPDVMNTTLDAHLQNCAITTEGLSKFVTYWMKGGKLDLSKLAKREKFHIDAKVQGSLNRMTVQPVITSRIGSASGRNVCIDNILSNKPKTISGVIRAKDLDLGRIIGTDLLGPATLTVDAKAAFGGKDAPINADIRSLVIEKLHLHGYDYSDIYGEAVISDKALDGRITCNDPNLNFMTQGRYAKVGQDTRYDFVVMLGDADLNKINIDKRGKSKIRFTMKADFTRTPAKDIFGDIAIRNLWLENKGGSYNIGDITVNSINRTNSTYKMELKSSFAGGSITGTAPVTEFIKDLVGVTLKRELPALFEDPSYQYSGNRYQLKFHFGNSLDILAWALPGMYIADNTNLEANINDRGRLTATLNSQLIAFKKQHFLRDISMNVNNSDGKISGSLTGSELKIATMKMSDNIVTFLAEKDHVGVSYSYHNTGTLENKGEFVIHGDLSRDADGVAMDVKFLPSSVHINSREWKIRPSNLSLNKNGIKTSNVEFVSDVQKIHLYGGTSKSQADTLNLNLEQFDLSIVNPVFKTDLGIRGLASGSLQLTSPLEDKGILVDLTCDSTYFANCKIGQMNVSSYWDEAFRKFNILAQTRIDGRTAVDANAKFTPKTSNLEAHAKLDRVSVGYLKPLLKTVFSEIDGYASGEILADGPISNLEWESSGTKIEDGMIKVDFTNVPYYVNGGFTFSNRGLFFDSVHATDRFGGTATVGGGIKWNSKFQDIYYDINIRCNEIEGINLTDKQNEHFYGHIFGTGNVTFIGPGTDMVMNVDATTAKAGTLHVPISNKSVSGRSNLLKFTEIKVEKPLDPYEIFLKRNEKSAAAKAKFTTNMKINAMPDVEAFIWIDKASGHMLSGHGNGTIQMSANEDKFDITGDYAITKGNYKFVAYGIVNRDFEIQDGSTIKFNGDILDSDLSIDAMYKTKASIGTLIGDSTSVANRRTVECKIKITDKILNPRLQFGIEIPELDPTVKSRVESALSTEDKVQKQFLSLLLSNSFLPDEQSGIVNNSTMLYSNVSEVMASQLNNILEKLNIPVDLGLNYQPNSKGHDVFDVAVSTQMFNNRVVVNGSVGNKQYTENAQTDVVGDIDIEVKLNKSGALRLNIFSHSADSYTNYLDNSQRNGVGLTYQTEFSSFKQLLKNIFSSKKKRQEAKRAEEEARLDEEKTTLKIE